jgi:lipopolysaccharide/colanic/teichoic acid biosynthesis glycosyltransferase
MKELTQDYIQATEPSGIAPSYYLKRSIDGLLALPLFLLSIPLIVIAAIAIKLFSHGSVFFVQERIGYQGKVIRIQKLRTMHINAQELLENHLQANPEAQEEWQRHFKLKNDPRIIPFIGNLLRKTSMDELPQFWNVLKGDMSMVGPRPFPKYHLDAFPREFQCLRQQVKPGLTGLWQVSARSDSDIAQQEQLDRQYIAQRSFLLDMKIIFKTFYVVLAQKGAC